ncbi:gustatory receptor for sugar taste 43a-like [Zophobas morio]|uniref:gustatory receptor for sugar taste 43a-like n=1 Tax=Zophobas morio TaxID=2755281 RepID=UPI00308345D2
MKKHNTNTFYLSRNHYIMANPSVTVSEEMFKPFFPIHNLSRAICLLPLKWKKSDFSHCIAKSWIYIAYSYFTGILIVTTGIFGLFRAYQLNVIYSVKSGSSTGFWVKIIDVTVVMSNFTVGVLATSYKINTYLNYFRHLTKVDYLLQKKLPRSFYYFAVTAATVLIVLTIFIFDLVIGLEIGSKSQNVFTLFAYFFPFYVAYFSIFVIELVYWQLVYSIKVRLVVLNENLREINCGRGDNFCVRNNRKAIGSLVDTLKTDFNKGRSIKSTPLEKFVVLMKAYEGLSDAARTVNDFYGLVMVVVLLGCLVHLLVSPYSLRNVLMFEQSSATFIVPQFMWVGLHISRLILIIEPCHGCLQQVKETTALVCKLRLSDTDEEFRRTMDFFLSFLSQCKIEFSAFGVTTFGRNLLPAIAGAATTYLVILFQFPERF